MTHSPGWLVFNGAIFVAWIVCMVTWIKRGCPIPRWVHTLAALLFIAGAIAMAMLWAKKMLSPSLAIICTVAGPAAYIGWLWMLGPWQRDHSPETESTGQSPSDDLPKAPPEA